jgi:hypothetical protein
MSNRREFYRHRQFGWLIIVGPLLAILLLTILLPRATGHAAELLPQALRPALYGLAVFMMLLFGALELAVTDEALEWRFGIGLLHGKVLLSEIEHIAATRTTMANGWGLRRTPRGWLYNISGFDALELRLKSGKLVLFGTDEPVALRQALEKAVATYGS